MRSYLREMHSFIMGCEGFSSVAASIVFIENSVSRVTIIMFTNAILTKMPWCMFRVEEM